MCTEVAEGYAAWHKLKIERGEEEEEEEEAEGEEEKVPIQ